MQDKSSIRKELLKKRDDIPPEVRMAKNRLIQANLGSLSEVKSACTIFLYASFRSEVDTFQLISNALSSGKRVILPKVDATNKMLQLYEIKSLEELAPGYMGIPELPGTAATKLNDVSDIDAVIIPGACYDEKGNRVGYGGGYYDRLLSGLLKTVPIVAPAYEEQIVESIPAEPHDIKVSVIVTDRRVIRCGI
jgi:5-formyltetrahydrofolate cyclo-ligase